ncbi:non-ribosomal peptide synthetase [Psychromicrobium lacuslunae]|uniref:non-ribosomal peptide synthetase n=1 Tax=Psychromicrobium lacuslunae TaxID=1618207 RepID=UPI0005D4600E|nr:non-ribosomal peptide synthetase [Psychromicrobium lacuslunae]
MTNRNYFEPIAAAFHRQVELNPEKVAIRDPSGDYTFSQVWELANQLAVALRSEGVLEGARVGVLGVGSQQTIVAMLGAWLSGICVVPLDPAHPEERIIRIVELGDLEMILTSGDYRLSTVLCPQKCITELAESQPGVKASSQGSEDSAAYILFTSGSTGTPKGVVVPQGALAALSQRPGPTQLHADDVFLVHTTLAFDPSMLEIWSALLIGASVLCAPHSVLSLAETAKLLADPLVTVAVLTPAIFALMVERYAEELQRLRCLIIGGDVMPAEQARIAIESCPQLDIVNCYGPTENTIISTAFRLSEWQRPEGAVPIGVPIAGASCHVLDGDLEPVAQGEVGELYVGGDRLALEYFNDPATTNEAFISNPFSSNPSDRIYRTGDQVAMLPDGNLEFRGRVDHEIKVRGHRVNLTEVENLLLSEPLVREVAAIAVGQGHERRIRAFVRLREPESSLADLRTHLLAKAPSYLVPDFLDELTAFPLNTSGKIDRKALAERDSTPISNSSASADPAGIVATVTRLWTEHSGSEPQPGIGFFEAGGTSLDLIRLIDDIAKSTRIELPFEDVYGVRSVEDLTEMLVLGGYRSAIAGPARVLND